MSFSSTAASSAKGGDSVFGGTASDGGSMNINFGNGVSQSGDGVSMTAIYAGLAIAGFFVWKRYS
ncbi:MAG: hypothetical protein ABIR56_04150 [Polaromonas sp.]